MSIVIVHAIILTNIIYVQCTCAGEDSIGEGLQNRGCVSSIQDSNLPNLVLVIIIVVVIISIIVELILICEVGFSEHREPSTEDRGFWSFHDCRLCLGDMETSC